jgi:hypothetical protein
MNPKTKKLLLICVAIVIGSYIARSFVTSYQRMVYARQQMIQRQAIQQQKPEPAAPVKDTAESTLAKEAEAMGNLSGVWEGRGPTPSRGICNLRVELKQGDPGHYTGYSRFSCIPVQSMLGAPKGANTMANLMTSMNPDAAILTGIVEKGAIQLHTDKTIGTDINGCAVSELTLTPFGASATAAEWKEGTCQGGSLMLQRAR